MSPRAAWRLEGLGFEKVYDYMPGKADWFANGLPSEGKLASVPTIGDAARKDVPTCGLKDGVGDAWDRVRKAGWDRCVVVNEDRVVLGLLREEELSSDPKSIVEAVMRDGPTTFRPHEPVGKLAERMRKRGVSSILVTTSDGRLVGLLYRQDAERIARRPEAEGEDASSSSFK
jgi:CBS domain-containing protein